MAPAGSGADGAAGALAQMLGALDAPPLREMLPRTMGDVEGAQLAFKHACAPEVQRAFPPLIEAAVCALRAKYELLKGVRSAGGFGGAELGLLRAQAEAVVAFAGLSLWVAAEVLGSLHISTATSHRIASWLADMA